MFSFPISNLPLHLVEKIFAKTDTKSNFRLRQTCRDVHDLIKSSPNITVPVEGLTIIEFTASVFEFLYKPKNQIQQILADVEGFHGARLEDLSFLSMRTYAVEEAAAQGLYNYLRKYRITCDNVDLPTMFSVQQQAILLKILKPVKVSVDLEEGSNLLDALIATKSVSNVEVFVPHKIVLAVTKKLLARFTEVKINLAVTRIDQQRVFSLLNEILKTLLLTSSSIRKFQFIMYKEERISKNDLEQAFPNFSWIQLPIQNGDEKFSGEVQLPSSFPQGSICSLTVQYYRNLSDTIYELCYEAGKSLM